MLISLSLMNTFIETLLLPAKIFSSSSLLLYNLKLTYSFPFALSPLFLLLAESILPLIPMVIGWKGGSRTQFLPLGYVEGPGCLRMGLVVRCAGP